MNLRADLLPEEILHLNELGRCEGCNHLTVFHHMDDVDGFLSFCEIEECTCKFNNWESKWVLEEKNNV